MTARDVAGFAGWVLLIQPLDSEPEAARNVWMLMPFHTDAEIQARHLTGRYRGRAGWFGRIVLQVEVKSPKPLFLTRGQQPGPSDPWVNGSYLFWRDAKAEDLRGIMMHVDGPSKADASSATSGGAPTAS